MSLNKSLLCKSALWLICEEWRPVRPVGHQSTNLCHRAFGGSFATNAFMSPKVFTSQPLFLFHSSIVVREELVIQAFNSSETDCYVDDSEALVCLQLLASHETGLTTESSALERKHVASEYRNLLMVMPTEYDVWLLATFKRLDQLLNLVRVSVCCSVIRMKEEHRNVVGKPYFGFPLAQEMHVLATIGKFLSCNKTDVSFLLEPLVMVAIRYVKLERGWRRVEQPCGIFQLCRSTDVSQFVNVSWPSTHAFEVVPWAVDVFDSFLLKSLDHLKPEAFEEVFFTAVRVAVVPELDVSSIEGMVMQSSLWTVSLQTRPD